MAPFIYIHHIFIPVWAFHVYIALFMQTKTLSPYTVLWYSIYKKYGYRIITQYTLFCKMKLLPLALVLYSKILHDLKYYTTYFSTSISCNINLQGASPRIMPQTLPWQTHAHAQRYQSDILLAIHITTRNCGYLCHCTCCAPLCLPNKIWYFHCSFMCTAIKVHKTWTLTSTCDSN